MLSDASAYVTFTPALEIKQGSTISLELMVEFDASS
jgi:hypothetical protein